LFKPLNACGSANMHCILIPPSTQQCHDYCHARDHPTKHSSLPCLHMQQCSAGGSVRLISGTAADTFQIPPSINGLDCWQLKQDDVGDMVSLFRELGEAQDADVSTLERAAEAGHLDVVAWLRAGFANKMGQSTALRHTSVQGHFDAVAWLKEQSAHHCETGLVSPDAHGFDVTCEEYPRRIHKAEWCMSAQQQKPRLPCAKQDLSLTLQPLEVTPCPSRFQCELHVGKYTTVGEKLHWPTQWVNQDSYLVVPLPPNQLLVAVFDGHGEHGHHVAKQVKQIFEQQAVHISQDISGPMVALKRTFALCQASLRQQEELCCLSGTTATVALIDMGRQHVTVAHVGDSTLAIVRDGKLVFTTKDHKVDYKAEQRIRAYGGVVQALPVCPGGEGGTRRVFMKDKHYPGLAMSRALGDLVANKLGVLAEPEVITGLTFAPQDSVLLATDGLWDVLPKERVVTNISSLGVPDTNATARSLVLQARECWPAGMDIDDITAVLVQAVSVSETVGHAGVAGSHSRSSRSSSSSSSSSSGRTRTPDANAIPPWLLGAVT